MIKSDKHVVSQSYNGIELTLINLLHQYRLIESDHTVYLMVPLPTLTAPKSIKHIL